MTKMGLKVTGATGEAKLKVIVMIYLELILSIYTSSILHRGFFKHLQTSLYEESDMQMSPSLTHKDVDFVVLSCPELAQAQNHSRVVTVHKAIERLCYSLYQALLL